MSTSTPNLNAPFELMTLSSSGSSSSNSMVSTPLSGSSDVISIDQLEATANKAPPSINLGTKIVTPLDNAGTPLSRFTPHLNRTTPPNFITLPVMLYYKNPENGVCFSVKLLEVRKENVNVWLVRFAKFTVNNKVLDEHVLTYQTVTHASPEFLSRCTGTANPTIYVQVPSQETGEIQYFDITKSTPNWNNPPILVSERQDYTTMNVYMELPRNDGVGSDLFPYYPSGLIPLFLYQQVSASFGDSLIKPELGHDPIYTDYSQYTTPIQPKLPLVVGDKRPSTDPIPFRRSTTKETKKPKRATSLQTIHENTNIVPLPDDLVLNFNSAPTDEGSDYFS